MWRASSTAQTPITGPSDSSLALVSKLERGGMARRRRQLRDHLAWRLRGDSVDSALWSKIVVENSVRNINMIVARPKGFEPLTPRFVVWCSIQLSYGRIPLRGVGDRAPHEWAVTQRPEGAFATCEADGRQARRSDRDDASADLRDPHTDCSSLRSKQSTLPARGIGANLTSNASFRSRRSRRPVTCESGTRRVWVPMSQATRLPRSADQFLFGRIVD
jgi:hypothetical protein